MEHTLKEALFVILPNLTCFLEEKIRISHLYTWHCFTKSQRSPLSALIDERLFIQLMFRYGFMSDFIDSFRRLCLLCFYRILYSIIVGIRDKFQYPPDGKGIPSFLRFKVVYLTTVEVLGTAALFRPPNFRSISVSGVDKWRPLSQGRVRTSPRYFTDADASNDPTTPTERAEGPVTDARRQSVAVYRHLRGRPVGRCRRSR